MSKELARPKSRELERFGLYLRYGIVFPDESEERKFNPYHDPTDGRFTFAPGGGTLPPRAQRANMGMVPDFGPARPSANPKAPAPQPRRATVPPTQRPTRQVDHGGLSAQYESGARGNPGEVSTGTGDRGGVSYGPYQLASKTGTASAFAASPEARKWSREFQGLTPGTSGFSAKWRHIAAREPAVFLAAQKAYIDRSHYQVAAGAVARRTGYDPAAHSEALRQVTFSTAVHHGSNGGAGLIAEAIKITDRQYRRTNAAYQAALINNVYDQRAKLVTRLRDSERLRGNLQRATIFNNILKNRFPSERIKALRMLSP